MINPKTIPPPAAAAGAAGSGCAYRRHLPIACLRLVPRLIPRSRPLRGMRRRRFCSIPMAAAPRGIIPAACRMMAALTGCGSRPPLRTWAELAGTLPSPCACAAGPSVQYHAARNKTTQNTPTLFQCFKRERCPDNQKREFGTPTIPTEDPLKIRTKKAVNFLTTFF